MPLVSLGVLVPFGIVKRTESIWRPNTPLKLIGTALLVVAPRCGATAKPRQQLSGTLGVQNEATSAKISSATHDPCGALRRRADSTVRSPPAHQHEHLHAFDGPAAARNELRRRVFPDNIVWGLTRQRRPSSILSIGSGRRSRLEGTQETQPWLTFQ